MHLLRRSCRMEGRNGPRGNPANSGQSSRPLLPIRTLLEDKEDSKDYSKDSVSAIKNISSTLASLTNSSNAAATRKTSYSPRFDPFSSTIDLDSPLCPPRKEPYLGPAIDNTATSNLDPPIDTGSKEGFKDTITSSIVKELSKKAYTIPDNRYKKRKDLKGKGLKTSSNNKAKYKDNQPRRRPRDPALYNSWLYNTGSIDHISNSKERFTTFTPNIGQLRPINTGNGPVSLASIGSIILEVLSRKAPPTYTKLVLDNVLYLPNIDINIVSRVRFYDLGGCLIKETLYGGDGRYIAILDFKKSGFFLDVKGSSKPIIHANLAFPLGLSSYTTKSIELQRNKIVVEIPSNSIRKEDYRPIIEDAIVSEAIEPNKRYKLRNSPAKGTTLEGIGPSLRGKRPYRPWIIGLFSELHRPIDYSITLYGDNQGSITVANDLALYTRTKYTLLKFRYVREQVKAKIVTIIYLNTKQQRYSAFYTTSIIDTNSAFIVKVVMQVYLLTL
ncbi:hypothetical protein P8C59_008062 [Phyllachora maydis]|uniref:Retrovirus-related Pol polyprotein from transposon TNT 1-94-like beta-barrel domain-containing protein n=1 Tax=Phyllachora maydis TaxID=1825666 RepID=A0AAD9IAD5_9PEZI|nr:hypothetical protein P8C59_008062 [Phyllachora maydis]